MLRRLYSLLPALALACLPVWSAQAQSFDEAALSALDTQFAELAASGVRPGYAIIIAEGETIVHVSETGYADLGTQRPMTVDTPVRIASMSKPVTAFATMMLIESGDIGLDDPVSDYIPAFADAEVAISPMANGNGEIETRAPSTPITVRHLLTHTAGLGYLFDGDTDLGKLYQANSLYEGEGDLEARMDQLAALPLYADPGQTWIYSYANDVLGRVVEVASEQPFETFLETRIFSPLAMHDTGFFYEDVAFDEADMAILYGHDENGAMHPADLPMPDWASGGAGLISTASDYIRFAMMLTNGGRLGDVRLIDEDTLAEMMAPQVTSEQLGGGWGAASYGFSVAVVIPPQEGQEPQGFPGDASWSGIFDTDFVVMPSQRISAVAMTQIQPGPNRPEPRTNAVFRPMLYGSIIAAQQ